MRCSLNKDVEPKCQWCPINSNPQEFVPSTFLFPKNILSHSEILPRLSSMPSTVSGFAVTVDPLVICRLYV